jgi:NADH-quinone oxidoreductase subunit J
MDLELVLFYAFAAVLVAAAAAVVLVRNPVHAVLCLVLAFFTSACLWILMRAEFLGIALVLVYVGAVMVLFLFVVMMLDVKLEPLREGFARYLPLGVAVAVLMAIEMFALLGIPRLTEVQAPPDPAAAQNIANTAWLGKELFTSYMLPFEVAAVILTLAIVAAVALTLRHRKGVRHQDPARQVLVRKQDRLRLVKMPPAGATGEQQP